MQAASPEVILNCGRGLRLNGIFPVVSLQSCPDDFCPYRHQDVAGNDHERRSAHRSLASKICVLHVPLSPLTFAT